MKVFRRGKREIVLVNLQLKIHNIKHFYKLERESKTHVDLHNLASVRFEDN